MTNGKKNLIRRSHVILIDIYLDSVGKSLHRHCPGNLLSGTRFPPMGHAYDRQYSTQMKQVASKNNIELREGVYCALGNNQLTLFPFFHRINFCRRTML